MIPSPMGALTGAEPPPFNLPGSHFTAALGFLVLGGVGLIWTAPALVDGAFLAPRVTAVTHLFTLGWITTTIMGALYQLLPVALEREIRWIGLARLSLVLHVPGLLLFVAGLVTLRPAFTLVGASFFSLGLLAFVVNLGATLKGAHRRDMTWWALTSAACFLFFTVILGVALATNVRWPFMGANRIMALATHLHVALIGWVVLVMVGVGQRLLPMFLLSHDADERPGRWAVGLLASGTLLLFSLHHMPGAWARRLPAAVIMAGAVAFLLQARAFYRARKRPVLDPGMRMVAAALVVLAAGAAQGVALTVVGFGNPRLATAYVASLVLGITLFVAAHYYKIVPFLVWFHRFGPVAGKRPVPKVAELYSARVASAAAVLLTAGAGVLLCSIAMGSGTGALTGATAFLAGTLVEATQMALVARKRPE